MKLYWQLYLKDITNEIKGEQKMFNHLSKTMAIYFTALLTFAACFVHTAYADDEDDDAVQVKVFAPGKGDVAGVGSRAFLVDMSVTFPGDLASTGATPELTGPGPLQNAGPFPGTFSAGANRDHFPGLVVLLSSTTIGAGPGQNVANLFNVNAITHQEAGKTEIWSTWIVGAPNAFGAAGQLTPSHLYVAVVEGTAPDVVLDMDNNGVINMKDLMLMGYKIISNTPKVDFVVNGFATGF